MKGGNKLSADKEFDIKKTIEESHKFEDLPIEEQWSLISFMISTVESSETREVIEFLIKKVKELEQKFNEIVISKT